MDPRELREKFLVFFKEKGHKIIPSSSLIPSDSSVLFTTAGMQQLSLFLSGVEDPVKKFGTRHLCSCQKCFRSDDIEEIGDDTHFTFFEMLGNWSIGEDKEKGYFKKEAATYALDFLTNVLKLDKERLWVTYFKGNKDIPEDLEMRKIWIELGVPEKRIREFGEKDNFWGPVGERGVCGPNSEIHYDRGAKYGCGEKKCGPNCENCQRFVEIWNLVFIEYFKNERGEYKKLPLRSVDTGLGFERVTAILAGKESAYETYLFEPLIKKIEEISGRNYEISSKRAEKFSKENNKKVFRIIVDHIRGSVFLGAEGISPDNLGRGYILRRLLRRAMRYGKMLELPSGFLIPLAQEVINIYGEFYQELRKSEKNIITIIKKEEERFEKVLSRGLKKFSKLIKSKKSKVITGEEIFNLYQSYGFPFELTKELSEEKGFRIDEEGYKKFLEKHRVISRAGAEKKFGGLGKNVDYESRKLHTATHLLQAALRQILGRKVRQMGSDITSERLRFDFSYPRALSEEEIKKVEKLVNKKIKENLKVERREMDYKEALEAGALTVKGAKYPKKVSVYFIYNPSESLNRVFSIEVCAGPHVERTSELGHFRIIKEKSSGAGIRRIKAILSNKKNV